MADETSMRRFAHSRRMLPLALVALAALGLDPAAGASAGSPRLKSAKALDTDRDGSVDAFDLSFSASVRGKADASAPFRFAVAGYRVTGAGAPRGRTVRVKVAETRVCDLATRPKVSYRPGSGGLQSSKRRRLRASRVVAGKAARGVPRIVCAATSDSDSDGHLDSLVLGYSKKVRNRAQASGSMPFQVDRYSVASVGKARGMNLTLRLREKEGYDTDAVPAVIYKSPRVKRNRRYAVSGSGGRARSATFNATRDRATARLVSASTADTDQNGLLDSVRATFSEPVRASGGAVEVAGAEVTEVTGGERETVTAGIRQVLDTGARPGLTLGAGDSLRDAAQNSTGRLSVRTDDRAAPVVVSAASGDAGGGPGRIDAVSVTFSEPVSHRADSDGSYPFSIPGYSIQSAGEAAGSSLVLTLTENGAPDSGVRPTVGYARGTGAPVADAAGNEAAGRTYAGTRDGVAPILVRVSLLDTDLDGMVDAVRYDYSETVSHVPSDCRASCSFSLAGYALEVAGPSAGASVTVGVTEQSGGATVTTAGYSSLGEGVIDSAGNRAPSATMPTADASPPVAVSSETADADADGRIDRIDLTFSEPISSAADSAAPFSFTASGYSVSGVSAASGDQLSVSLAEKTEPDTGSAPTVAYNGQGSKLIDDNGTEHATRSYPNLTRDAVAPVFVASRTADTSPAEGDGRLDAVDFVYSEDLAGGSSTAPFTISGRTPAAVAYPASGVRVSFADAASPDTSERPNASYSGGDLQDLPEGAGDTAENAPDATGQAEDGAGPVVVAATTGDSDVDGKLDAVSATFSEPIQYSAGDPPAVALTSPLLPVGAVSPSGAQLDIQVIEGPEPDGGVTPTVAVTDPTRVRDLATVPNPARGGPFSATDDGVRPTLIDARYGEAAAGGSCEVTPPQDGQVDCFRAMWSEAVSQPSSASVFSNSPRAPLAVMSTAVDDATDISVTPGSTPDRDDNSNSLSYAGGGGVEDGNGNDGLPAGPIGTTAACIDNVNEDNDVQDTGSPGSPSMNVQSYTTEQVMCAFDPDWFSVVAQGAGEVNVRVDPSEGIVLTAGLYDATGTLMTSATSPGPGLATALSHTSLVPGELYWVQIAADLASPEQEGPYCADPTPQPGENCQDGDDTPQ